MLKCGFNKVLCDFIKIALRHGRFPVYLLYIFKTLFYKNTSGGLLLNDQDNYHILPQDLNITNNKLVNQPIDRFKKESWLTDKIAEALHRQILEHLAYKSLLKFINQVIQVATL